jgi:hypothetical protein
MDDLPTCTSGLVPARTLPGAIPGDAVTNLLESAELLNVDMDHFAGALAFITAHGLGPMSLRGRLAGAPGSPSLQIHPFAEAMCLPVSRCRRSAGFGATAFDNVARHLLSTQRGQAGILLNVHSVVRQSPNLEKPQLSQSGRNGQPPESSQLIDCIASR